MSDTTAAKLTMSGLASDLVQVRSDLAEVQEAASAALQVGQINGDKIQVLDKERIAMAKAVGLQSDRIAELVTKVAQAPATPAEPQTKMDGVLARVEALEQRTSGETGDWGPVITAVDNRLRELALVVDERTPDASLLEQLNVVRDQLAQNRSSVDSAAAAVASAEELKPVFSEWMDTRIRQLVRSRASFEQDLLVRLETLETRLFGDLSATVAPTGQADRLDAIERAVANLINDQARQVERDGDVYQIAHPNTASVKVLDLMRMVDVIGKDKDYVGNQARFKFRGVDQAMDAVGHAMRSVGLTLETKVLDRQMIQDSVVKRDNSGKEYSQLWTTTVLTMQYAFVDPATGHQHKLEMVGEGRDLSDKSSSKAAAMACKYSLFQGLMIPVEGFNDTDSDSERPVIEQDQRDTPGRQVSQGRMTPAQAVNEYTQRGYQGDAAGPEDPAIGRPANAFPVPQDDDLAQRAAFAARHLMEIQREPANIALPAIRKAKARIEELGIGDYVVSLAADGSDKAPLSAMVAAALQSVNAAVGRSAGSQGVTRQGQQTGEGARAALDAPPADSDYQGTEQEYLDALKALGSNAPGDVQQRAEEIVMRWESTHRD